MTLAYDCALHGGREIVKGCLCDPGPDIGTFPHGPKKHRAAKQTVLPVPNEDPERPCYNCGEPHPYGWHCPNPFDCPCGEQSCEDRRRAFILRNGGVLPWQHAPAGGGAA